MCEDPSAEFDHSSGVEINCRLLCSAFSGSVKKQC